METEVIEITKEDLRQYYKTSSNRCKVRLVRSKIYNSMPRNIKEEFKTKVNDLKELSFGVFIIKAKDGSENLNQFLARFLFQLIDSEDISPEIT